MNQGAGAVGERAAKRQLRPRARARTRNCTRAQQQRACSTSSPTSDHAVPRPRVLPEHAARSATSSSTRSSLCNIRPWTLGLLRHELGHTLGFRHEHTRPEAGTCFEDNNWRALTPYDSASVMHYPQCNGTSSDLSMTATDRQGAVTLYGS